MDALMAALTRHEDEAVTGWLKSLEAVKGAPFGGLPWTDPAKEVRIAYKSLLAILESGNSKPAEEHAARIARLPSQRGAGIMATIRGCYALFEPLRGIIDKSHAGHPQQLSSDVERLRNAVATLTGLYAIAHSRCGLAWQDISDRYARQRLNGPIAKLTGDLQAFSIGPAGEMPAPAQESLRNLISFGRDILRAAEGLGILTRLGEGRLPAAAVPVPVAETLAPAAEEARRRASFTNRTLTWKAPAPNIAGTGDADLVRRVFMFVLLRALEETPEGHTVRAEVLDDADAVRIVVRDEGPGEEPEEGRGEGFEITFARMALEHMEGRCDVFREPGRGSMVQLKLKRASVAPPPKPGVSAGSAIAPSAPAAPAAPEEPAPTLVLTQGAGMARLSAEDSKDPAAPKPESAGKEPPTADPPSEFRITRSVLPPQSDKPRTG